MLISAWIDPKVNGRRRLFMSQLRHSRHTNATFGANSAE